MKNNTNTNTNNTNNTNKEDVLKKMSVLKSTTSYNTEKTRFSYAEKVGMIVAVMQDKMKVKSLIGSLKQSTAFNAFLCLQDVNTKEEYENLWEELKKSLKEKGFKLAGTPLHKCFCSLWYLKSEQKTLFTELTEGKDSKDAFLSLSSFLKSKEVSFTLPVSRIKSALNAEQGGQVEQVEQVEQGGQGEQGEQVEQVEQGEQGESPIEQAIRLLSENLRLVTTEQAEMIIGLLESKYLANEKAA